MKLLKKSVLYLNEKFLMEEIQPEITKNILKLEISNILDSNNYLDTNLYDAKLHKMIYDKCFELLLNKYENIKNNIKIYSELNIFEHFLQNNFEFSKLVHPLWNDFESKALNKTLLAHRDFYTFYKHAYDENLLPLDLKNMHVIVDSSETYNQIIKFLCSIHKIENNKITNLIYRYENTYFDKTKQTIREDKDQDLFNIQKTVDGKLRQSKPRAFKLTFWINGATNSSNFSFKTTADSKDIYSDYGIRYASIYDMIHFYLSTITIDMINVPTEEGLFRGKTLYESENNLVYGLTTPDRFRGVSIENEEENYREYPQPGEGYIKPFERYFAIKYLIKNNIFEEEILLSMLDSSLLAKYNHIKNFI